MADKKRSAQELVQFLRRQGISTTELAGALQRSPRMIRKIVNGETSGVLYRDALEEIARTGRVNKVPPRRRLKDGSLMPVRGKTTDGQAKMIIPEDPGGKYTTDRQGGRLRINTAFMGEGGRIIEAHLPKGKAAKGREAANDQLIDVIRRAAKGQAGKNQKQVYTRLTFANGREMQVNSYNASTMLQRIKESGGNIVGWLATEGRNRYVNLDSDTPITGVTFNIVDAGKTAAYEKNKDRGHDRTTRPLTAQEKQLEKQRAEKEARRSARRGGRS